MENSQISTVPSASQKITKKYYETTSARGHRRKRIHYEEAARTLRWRLGKWLPLDRNARILDLGCGTGELLFFLEESGYGDLHGVDLCQEELKEAQAFIKAELICDHILNYLHQTKGAFESVIGLNILEHLSKDEVLEAFEAVSRVLIPGGTFIVMVPNAISPLSNIPRHWDYTHEWAFTPNNFQQLAALSGFESEIELRECGPVPHGLKSIIRFALWKAVKLIIRSYLLIEVADTKGGVYTMDMLVRLRKKDEADAE